MTTFDTYLFYELPLCGEFPSLYTLAFTLPLCWLEHEKFAIYESKWAFNIFWKSNRYESLT